MKSLALAALAFALPAQAQMYKCVDERGVTHYADKPRPGCKGGKVDIQAAPPMSGTAAPARPSGPQQDADFRRRQSERERADAALQAQLQQKCARLRQEQAWLSSGGRLSEIDPKGQRTYVDDASRNTRLLHVREELRGCP